MSSQGAETSSLFDLDQGPGASFVEKQAIATFDRLLEDGEILYVEP